MNPKLFSHYATTANKSIAEHASDVNLAGVLYKLTLLILVTILFVRVVFWLTNFIPKFFKNYKLNEGDTRFSLRIKTISSIINSLAIIVAGAYLLVSILSMFGVNVLPLITGIGFLGLAVTFGAQNLVKDIINGFFIILEDQYGVGDVIKIGEYSGLVEDMNLRITTLRDASGNVHIIPNGEIKQVTILTKHWSKAPVELKVYYKQDIEKIVELLKVEADKFAVEFSEDILDTPEVIGLERIDGDSVILKVLFKTTPLSQWKISREYSKRILLKLNKHNIQLTSDLK